MISLCNTFKVCSIDSNTPGFVPDFNNYCHFFGGLFCVLFAVLFGLCSESRSFSVFTYFLNIWSFILFIFCLPVTVFTASLALFAFWVELAPGPLFLMVEV